MEGRNKLKFSEVSLQICQFFFERKLSKEIFDLNTLLSVYRLYPTVSTNTALPFMTSITLQGLISKYTNLSFLYGLVNSIIGTTDAMGRQM